MASKSDAFVVPAELTLRQEGGGIAIEHSGDIVLHGTLGMDITSVRSTGGSIALHLDSEISRIDAPEGSITVRGSISGGSVTAGTVALHGAAVLDTVEATDGGLEAHGDLTAKSARGHSIAIHGKATIEDITSDGGEVEIAGGGELGTIKGARVVLSGDQPLHVRVIQATESIDVGPMVIKADILIAPSVRFDENTTGKVTVLESRSEPGPSAVKGCLSLQDLDDLFGNADSFLEERGLSPLGERAAVADDGGSEDDAEPPAEQASEPDAPAATGGEEDGDADTAAETQPPMTEAEVEDAEEDPNDVPSVDELFAADEAEPEEIVEIEAQDSEQGESGGEGDPIFGQMSETVGRIASCYDDSTMPPAVTHLQELVDARDYAGIRDDITNIWNQLLKFHQKRGLRIQPQVTTTFNTINSIVRKL